MASWRVPCLGHLQDGTLHECAISLGWHTLHFFFRLIHTAGKNAKMAESSKCKEEANQVGKKRIIFSSTGEICKKASKREIFYWFFFWKNCTMKGNHGTAQWNGNKRWLHGMAPWNGAMEWQYGHIMVTRSDDKGHKVTRSDEFRPPCVSLRPFRSCRSGFFRTGKIFLNSEFKIEVFTRDIHLQTTLHLGPQ